MIEERSEYPPLDYGRQTVDAAHAPLFDDLKSFTIFKMAGTYIIFHRFATIHKLLNAIKHLSAYAIGQNFDLSTETLSSLKAI